MLCAVPARGPLAGEAQGALEGYGLPVAPVRIGQRAAFVHAMTAGQGAQEYEPGGKAAREIARLYDWTLAQASQPDLLTGGDRPMPRSSLADALKPRQAPQAPEPEPDSHRAPSRRGRKAVTIYLDTAAAEAVEAVEAVRRVRLAAEQGDADAQFNLGRMYAGGEGVAKDAVEAVRWYRLPG